MKLHILKNIIDAIDHRGINVAEIKMDDVEREMNTLNSVQRDGLMFLHHFTDSQFSIEGANI